MNPLGPMAGLQVGGGVSKGKYDCEIWGSWRPGHLFENVLWIHWPDGTEYLLRWVPVSFLFDGCCAIGVMNMRERA